MQALMHHHAPTHTHTNSLCLSWFCFSFFIAAQGELLTHASPDLETHSGAADHRSLSNRPHLSLFKPKCASSLVA